MILGLVVLHMVDEMLVDKDYGTVVAKPCPYNSVTLGQSVACTVTLSAE